MSARPHEKPSLQVVERMAKHMEGVNVAYAVRGNRVERGTKVSTITTNILSVLN